MIFQELSNALLFGTASEDPLEPHKDTIDRVPKFVKGWKGDVKKLYIIADRLEQLGKEIRNEIKETAGVEMSLIYGDEKKQTLYGNTITFSISPQYEYKDTKVVKQLAKDLEKVEKQMTPFKKKEKQIKKAVKSEYDRQVAAGEAKHTKDEYKLSISRK